LNNLGNHEKATQIKFDKWAENFEETGFIFRYFQKRVISMIGLQPDTNFLDLGCGTGWAVRHVLQLLQGEGRFIGIDISKKMIERAKAMTKGQKNAIFHNASSEDLPLQNNYFDNIICTFSFHHYLSPSTALSEIARVLKPKGRLFILDVTPDDFITTCLDKFLLRMQKEHVKQYSTDEFKQMFYKANLKHLKSKTVLLYPIKVHIAEK
jgi:demethylmenaquinone methyltransferase/2-methoxy-6-polyprenyl-1,4-benzoquinol methylase